MASRSINIFGAVADSGKNAEGSREYHQFLEKAAYIAELQKEKRSISSANMRGLKKEVLTVIYLDSSHAIIDSEIVAEGTLNVNTVYPREIIKRALEFHAAALIIAHNHPSGSLKPSAQDIKLTKTLALLCRYMQLQLLDHLIIGDGSYSFADNGLMDSVKEDCQTAMDSFNR
jgi:DNA repair protein RadC